MRPFSAPIEAAQRAIQEGKSKKEAAKPLTLPGSPDHAAPVDPDASAALSLLEDAIASTASGRLASGPAASATLPARTFITGC